jgi:hypothetical protein
MMIRHSLLVPSLYRLPVSRNYAADGAAGVNVNGYQWIDEQRQGRVDRKRLCSRQSGLDSDWLAPLGMANF